MLTKCFQFHAKVKWPQVSTCHIKAPAPQHLLVQTEWTGQHLFEARCLFSFVHIIAIHVVNVALYCPLLL